MIWSDYPGVAARFDAKVDRSGNCHLWTAATISNGYGSFILSRPARKTCYAHRLSMERALGRTLARHEFVIHSCDTPACVNPEHLSVGTQKQNMRDAASRGRTTHGVRNRHARLTEQEVREIRALLAAGAKQEDIAARYGVSRPTISLINTRATWAKI